MTESAYARRDEIAVSAFVERFALLFAESGVPRMPARVFAALLASDSGSLTAAELASRLAVSPAAVSGAVRYLTQVNLAVKERTPGTKRDRYRVRGDLWYEAAVSRDQMIKGWQESLREGIQALGKHTPAGLRLRDTLAFFEFLDSELPELMQRWRARRTQLHSEWNLQDSD